MRSWPTPSSAILSLLATLAIHAMAGQVQAQEKIADPQVPAAKVAPAQVIRVSLPLVGSADDRIRRLVTRLLDEMPEREGQRPIVVFEFVASDEGATSSFERCFAVARFLASDALSSVRTVAYVPQSLTGHDILPVLACEEIIIAGNAEFGAAGANEEQIGPAMKAAYEEIAARRRTIPPAVALAMLDSEATLLRADTAEGVRLVLQRDLPALQETTAVKSVDTLSPAGDLARFTGRQMRLELGLASHLAANNSELSAALEHPLEYVNTSQLLGDGGNAMRVDFTGVPSHQSVNRTIRLIAEGIGRNGVNQVVIWIDSSGGEPAESMRLAQYLSQLDAEQVQTIAYVPHLARGDATLVALAADQLVLGEEAQLGGSGERDFTPGEQQSLREPIKQLANDRGIGWSLPVGLIDHDFEVATYQRPDAPGTRVFSEEELAEQPEGLWQQVAPLDLGNGLSAQRAMQFGLVDETVASDEEFFLLHGLPTDLEAAEMRWSDVLVDALAREEIAFILLFVAFSMLLAEITVPGLGVPGFVSAVCFAMYFWSRYLHGTAEWLEVILFVLGAVFIIVEIFVIPGFGIFGIGGGLMMLAAVVLASQTFVVPTNLYQLEQIPSTLGTLLTCMAGMVVGVTVMRRLLPHTPGLNKVLLSPPEGEELEGIRVREHVVDWSHFLGQEGTTTTRLMPAGKARFGRQTIDVMSRGSMISSGEPVRVVEAVGNRVIVEPLDG